MQSKKLLLWELSASELGALLDQQYINDVPPQLWALCKKEKSLFRIVCHCFNCGYILGKQAERRRNRRKC